MITRRSLLASAAVAPVLVTVAAAAAQEATPGAKVTTELAIIYGEIDGTQLLLDMYRPSERDTPRPAVLLFHGGGMMVGDRSWMATEAEALAAAGYVAVTVGYRLFREDGSNPWPTQLDDAQRAVRWLRANASVYGVDPDRLAAFGASSGGQLAAFLGTRDTRDDTDAELAGLSSRVGYVVTLAGVMDLTIPFPDTGLNLSHAAILGGTAAAPPDQAAYRDFSPIAFVNTTSAPFLILQGGADTLLPIEHAHGMEAALHDAEVEVIYGEFPGVDHFAWDWAHSGPWALAFLNQHLRPEA